MNLLQASFIQNILVICRQGECNSDLWLSVAPFLQYREREREMERDFVMVLGEVNGSIVEVFPKVNLVKLLYI